MNRFHKSSILLFFSIFLISIFNLKAQIGEWENLLQNNTLNNFIQLNGDADFLLKDGLLIGISKLNTPNSFLATKNTMLILYLNSMYSLILV